MTRPIELQNLVSQAKAAEKLQRIVHHQPGEELKQFARDLESKSREMTTKPGEAEKSEEASVKEKSDEDKEKRKKSDKNKGDERVSSDETMEPSKDEEGKIGGQIDIRI